MSKSYSEYAFETAIEERLKTTGGYERVNSEAFDTGRALFSAGVISFIKETQPEQWRYLEDLQKERAEETLLEDLCHALNSEYEGCLSVIRHGFKCFGRLFRVAYFAPPSHMNPDTRRLYELQAKLDEHQVYFKAEIEEFAKVFYRPKPKQTAADHARINACIDPAVKRYGSLEEEIREEFRKTLVAFRNLYSFMAQIIPFQDSDLEKLYSYIRFLLNKLPRGDRGPVYSFDDDVALKLYRLQKIGEGSIVMEPGATYKVSGPTSVGTGVARDDEIELSKLIEILNERFGTEFKPGDELFFESIREDAVADSNLRQAALANTQENFGYVFRKALEGLFIDRMEQNEEITAKYMNEAQFREVVFQHLLKEVYEIIREQDRNHTR